jgi:hypothetical protein
MDYAIEIQNYFPCGMIFGDNDTGKALPFDG